MGENSKNVIHENIVDVVDDFDYSTQDESYNVLFRKWRREKGNPFAFAFAENKKERTYIDGRGFIASSAVEAEKKVLTDIFYYIGLALLIWIAFGDVLSKIIISLLSFIGVNIHNNYFSSNIYGGSTEIVTVLIILTFIKVFIPLMFLHRKFRLPAKVEFMGSLNSPMALMGAISTALAVCVVTSLPSAYSSESKEIYEFFKNVETDVSVWGQAEFIVYTIFDVIIISAVSEIFFRGAMFAVLRQFGDTFAIVITTLIAVFLPQNLQTMPAVALISLVASYGLVSSGSIFTSIAVVIIYKMYTLALAIIETEASENMPLTRNLFMMTVLVIGGLGMLVYWLYRVKTKQYNLAPYKSELKFRDRLIHSVKTFPFSAVALLCIASAIVKAVL
ncbi:MAG: CPBP family intramembrane metalloprotease [Ruminococcus flavefaciens]|nr:CPBP family intramembrane metalloprotease [Ruminococcus flavefaciens]MCM1229190.1 CPBP family intramembrane metalloprotease [Ruminococcus flavefaciens]